MNCELHCAIFQSNSESVLSTWKLQEAELLVTTIPWSLWIIRLESCAALPKFVAYVTATMSATCTAVLSDSRECQREINQLLTLAAGLTLRTVANSLPMVDDASVTGA